MLNLVNNSAKKTKKVNVLDYGWSNCGISSEIISQIAEKTYNSNIKINYLKITLPDYPAPTNKLNEKTIIFPQPKCSKKLLNIFLNENMVNKSENPSQSMIIKDYFELEN